MEIQGLYISPKEEIKYDIDFAVNEEFTSEYSEFFDGLFDPEGDDGYQ